jgi:hypothetical protein
MMPRSKRGHYFYRLRSGQQFGNGLGKLKAVKRSSLGRCPVLWRCAHTWGQPSIHGPVTAATIQRGPAGMAPEMPEEIAGKLNAAAERRAIAR